MKLLRVRVDAGLIERIFRTGHRTRDGRVVAGGIPDGFRLEQAHMAIEVSGKEALLLYFASPSGDGIEDVSPKLVAG